MQNPSRYLEVLEMRSLSPANFRTWLAIFANELVVYW